MKEIQNRSNGLRVCGDKGNIITNTFISISISRHEVYPIEGLFIRSRLCLTWIFIVSIIGLDRHYTLCTGPPWHSDNPNQYCSLLWITGCYMGDLGGRHPTCGYFKGKCCIHFGIRGLGVCLGPRRIRKDFIISCTFVCSSERLYWTCDLTTHYEDAIYPPAMI